MRIARLENQMRVASLYNPNDMFEVVKAPGFIRFYLGGKYATNKMFKDIDNLFYESLVEEFIPENGFPSSNREVRRCIEDAYKVSNLVEKLTRVRKGDMAVQINAHNINKFIERVVHEFMVNEGSLELSDAEYILDWHDDYEAKESLKVAIKAVMEKFGKMGEKKIDPRTYRLASTRKVAGHIILAGNMSVEEIKKGLKNLKLKPNAISDIDFEDGVISFLMSKLDDRTVEKKVRAFAKAKGLKFEKGEFTDGLGMIYTKNASRRNRRASKPMFRLKLHEQLIGQEEQSYIQSEIYHEEIMEKKIYSFEDLLKVLAPIGRKYPWGEWDMHGSPVSLKWGSDSFVVSDYLDDDADPRIRYVLYIGLYKGVELDRDQIKMIEEALDMR